MADPKARPSLRVDTLAAALEQKLEDEAAILDLLVSALARGQPSEPLWAQLHAAAARDDRLAELAFAYERLSRDKKLKSLTAIAQATVLGHAGVFFAEVFGDADGAESYLERALGLAPGDVPAFEKYEQILLQKNDLRRLGELYLTAAPHRGDKGEQRKALRRGADIVAGDAERALRINQEILKLDPTDDRAKGALAALYEKTGRLAELSKLLEQALAQDPPPADAQAMRLRLLALYAGPLGEIEKALPHVEEVLRFDPTHEGARHVAEELLSHKSLTARVAAALGRAYDEAGEPSEAARMLGVEIEAQRGPKRLDAQKRLARLTLEQLGDLEQTFALDEAIVPLDPADDEVRVRFVKLASALDKQLEATRSLTRAATGSRDAAVRARIGADMGDLYRELGDLKKARAQYQSVLDAGTDEAASLRAARAIRALCTEPRDPKGLAAVLGRLAEVEPEEGARVEALAELARISEEEIGEPAGAISAYERLLGTRLEAQALDALGRLYEAAGAWAALVGVLGRLGARERDPARARALAFRAADLRATKLPDRAAALEAWRAFVAAHGVSREALARLIPLLEHERCWEELGAALAKDAEIAPFGERAGIYARLGQLRLARLGDARGALAAHRQALSLDPAERSSRVAVDRMLSAGELRLAAADVLEPIARLEGSAPGLVRVLEVRSLLEVDPAKRLRALTEATEIAHAGLRDPRRALELAARGLAEALTHALSEAPRWIDRVEQLSAGGDVARRAAVLRDALGDRPIEDDTTALLARRAGEALVASGDVTGSLAVFRRALAFEPAAPDLLARLDELLREQGSPEERLALYRAALDKAESPGRRRELLHAMGTIERRDLGSPEAAIATYRRALGEDPGDRVAEAALLEVYEGMGAWEELYAELARVHARGLGEERDALLLRLAELSATRGWLDRAAAHYGAVVAGEGPLGDEVLAAAEKAAVARDDTALLRAVIERRVASSIDPLDEAAWLEKLGDLAERRLGDAAEAASAYRRAAASAEMLAEGALEARLLDRVLAVLPDDRAAALRLAALHREAEAWAKLPAVVAVLLRTARDAADAARTLLAFEAEAIRAGAAGFFLAEAERLLARGDALSREAGAALRAARARVLSQDPARADAAAGAYRAVLEAGDDESGVTARAFDAFLAKRGAAAAAERRWLFAHREARAPEGERVPLLMAWAAAEETTFGDPGAAAALYERAIALDPENDDALAARARLLLAAGDAAGAVAVLERRRALSEGSARAALDLALGALYLDRLDRPAAALDAITPVLEHNPQDREALALVTRALGHGGARRRAAELYEKAADAAEDAAAFTALMEVLLATPQDDPELRDLRRGWFERLLRRPGISPEHARDVALRAAAELPHDLALWERAEAFARELRTPEPVAEAYRSALGVAARGGDEAAAPIAGQEADVIEEVGRRAVEYHEEWFEEQETVVALLRRVTALAPGSRWPFERLKLIYNLAERWDDLFALYDDAVAHAPDTESRRELLEDAALAAKDLASDSARAMRYYEALYAIRPDPRVRAALERLFERHGRHRALIELYAAELSGLHGEAAQEQRARIAGLWLDGLGDAERAVAVVEEMLDAEPERPGAFELLERVMQRTAAAPQEAAEARQRAAGRLKEHYRADDRPGDLVRVLEIDLDSATTPVERAARLETIVRLRLDSLHDEAGAFEGLAALVTLLPEATGHRAELLRLGRKLGRAARLVDVLSAAAVRAAGAAQLDLFAQAADLCERELGDGERAILIQRSILATVSVPREAQLAAAHRLDRLLSTAGREPERADVLERIAELDPDPAARRAARSDLSRLAVDAGDAERAVRAFRAALAEDPADADAEEGLTRALEDAGRYAELVEILDRRAARADDERGRGDRVRVARLLEHELDEPGRAIEAWNEVRRVFGPDDESTDALASLLAGERRFAELCALLEAEATAAPDDARAADLWSRVGDVQRAGLGNLDEALAAYDLALEQRAGDAEARRGLEALVAQIDPRAPETRAALAGAVTSLSRVYAAVDDYSSMIAMLEPRLAVAATDAERVAVLGETATLLERRAGDAGGAFTVIFRAFTLSPSEALGVKVVRLAETADRWGDVAEALAGGLSARPDVPRPAARELLFRVGLWQRDRRDDLAAAEAALGEALALDPGSAPILSALADVQRRAPGRALVSTLLRLADVEGGRLDRYREAVEVAEGPVGDAALAKTLAEKLLDHAAARWDGANGGAFASAAEAAAWALEALARLGRGDGPAAAFDLFLRGARLPFDAGERRRLKLRAAELGSADATLGIYQELFEEDPNDALVSDKLAAAYRELGRLPALVALRERQIAAASSEERRAALRLDLARLFVEGGDRERAIATLEATAAAAPAHPPSLVLLAELYEASGKHAALATLSEARAAAAEKAGDRGGAARLWVRAAELAEQRLGDTGRAVQSHRHAAALGVLASEAALGRLFSARGEHAQAVEVLARICARTHPDALEGPALLLVDALRAAGKPGAARAELERAAGVAKAGSPLRERLAALYRETGEWAALAAFMVEDAARTPDRAARAARLREAAELYLGKTRDAAAAIPLLTQAAELVPDDAAVRLRLASALRATGDHEGAAAALSAVIAAYGGRRPKERAVVHYELAQLALAKGDRAKALGELDAALRIDPGHPDILHALARLSFEEGQLERAARTYRALLVVRRPRAEEGAVPLHDEVSRAEVLFELSEIARLRGEPDRAAEQLDSAFEAARESDAERDKLLAALRARSRHDVLARALEARMKGGVKGAEAAAILEELGSLYEAHLDRPADALDARLSAFALAPPSDDALSRALALAKRAGEVPRWVAAVRRLVEAEAGGERAVDLTVALGGALADARDDAGAAEAYVRAEDLAADVAAPRLPAIRRALLGVYERLGDAARTEALLERQVDGGGAPAELADALYRLAAMRLPRASTPDGALADALALVDRAFEADGDADRAEALLRGAIAGGAEPVAAGRALERLARATGRDRALVDALVLISGLDITITHVGDAEDERLDPIREAVEIAERLGDGALVESLLRRALGRAPLLGDAPLGWALSALAERRKAAGDLAEAADLEERAARVAAPERERALLLEVAALAAGTLGDLLRAARIYEELRAREPAEREIWQPLADVYRRLGDRARLAALLEETAPLLEGAAERGRLRLERARMAVGEDQDKAVSLLQEVVLENPAEIEAAVVLAELLEKLGRRDELAALIRTQLDAARDREDRTVIVSLSLRLGALLEQQWDEQGALDAYHTALDWEPKSREVLRQVVRLLSGRDDAPALGDALEQLLAVEEGAAAVDLALRLAEVRVSHGDAEGAVRALEQGWAARPGEPRIKQELTRRYTEAGAHRALAALLVREAETLTDGADLRARVDCLCRAAELYRHEARDPAAAAEVLERAQALEPASRDVLLALIDVYGALGAHARAAEAIGRALAVSPDDPWLYRARATLHEALGHAQAALLDLEHAYEKSGGGYAGELVGALSRAAASCAARGTPDARATERGLRLRLAEVLTRAGEIDRARAELTDLTRADGRDRAALRALAALEDASERWDAASAIYRRLLALEDGEALVETALKLADACQKGDRLGDARSALERAIRVMPGNPAVRERLREVYNVTGAARELAVLILEDAARAPDFSGRFALLMQAGRLLLAEGDGPQAATVLGDAKSLRPEDAEATLFLADALALSGRGVEARAVLETAVVAAKGRRSRSLAAVHRRIARLDLATGDRVAALGALSRAFDNEPQNGQLAMELGALAVEHEEYDLATRAFRAVTLMKTSPPGSTEGVTLELRAVAYYHLGRMAYIQGDRRKARLMIDKAVVDDPTLEAARALLDQLRSS